MATLDHGEEPDGTPWLVMDLCPGRPLSEALQDGPLAEQPCDRRTDIDSAGVLLYHMLTGHPPFFDLEAHRVMLQHVTEPPLPVRESAPDVPAALDDAVLRALEKDPDRRWPSAVAFREAIEAALGISRSPPPFGRRVSVTMACGVARRLVSLGRSGDQWLVRLEDRRIARLDPALLDLTTLRLAPGDGAGVVDAGDEVLVSGDGAALLGTLAERPPAPGAPLRLRGARSVARGHVRALDLVFRTPALRPGDQVLLRGARARVAWIGEGRVGLELPDGRAATLERAWLDAAPAKVLVPVLLDALWPA